MPGEAECGPIRLFVAGAAIFLIPATASHFWQYRAMQLEVRTWEVAYLWYPLPVGPSGKAYLQPEAARRRKIEIGFLDVDHFTHLRLSSKAETNNILRFKKTINFSSTQMATVFDLEKKRDFYLSLLIKKLERDNKSSLSKILLRSSIEVVSEFEYDNLDGGQYGHKVRLFLSEDIFLDIVDKKSEFENSLLKEFNKIYTPKNEYICDVEISVLESFENIPLSAKMIYSHNKMPSINDEDMSRIWKNPDNIKVFISHRDADKIEASRIQSLLSKYNISSFVAHEDIEGTEEWIKEILRALQSMDIFTTYMTKNFFDSNWTNQEIGFALGRNVPVIPIKNHINPEGFISILQAKPYSSENFCIDFISLLLKQKDIHTGLKEKTIDCIISALAEAESWDKADSIYKAFQHVKKLTSQQLEVLIKAFNTNRQINECIAISGYDCYGKCRGNGDITAKLEKWTGSKYQVTRVHGKVRIQNVE